MAAMTQPVLPSVTPLSGRGVLRLSGPDAKSMLQGLVSGDLDQVGPDHAIWAAFLTAQGKYLFDFFIVQSGDDLLLDCERERMDGLMKKLSMYKLRADVTLADASDKLGVFAVWGDNTAGLLGLDDARGHAASEKGIARFMDPRLSASGGRVIGAPDAVVEYLAACGFGPADETAFERHRIALGLPDGSRDMQVDKALLLENGFAELDGVSFEKGCYIGQEVTARTRYRGLVKKRLLPVTIDGPAPDAGAPVMAGERQVGEMRTHAGDVGLALLRVEHLENAPFHAGEATLMPVVPDWVELPASGDGS